MTKVHSKQTIAPPQWRAVVGLIGCTVFLGACATEPITSESGHDGERPSEAETVVDPDLGEVLMPSEAIPSGPGAEYTPDGLVRVPLPRTQIARLYVKPPRPHLQRYKKAVLTRAAIGYHKSTSSASHRYEENMRVSFERDLVDVLDSQEFWEITEEVDDETLILKATVAELQMETDGEGLGGTSATSFVNASGGAILGFEIFDAKSGEPLMRYIERHRLPAGVYSGTDVDGQRIRMVFRDFAKSLGHTLSFQYRYIREIERREKAAGGG